MWGIDVRETSSEPGEKQRVPLWCYVIQQHSNTTVCCCSTKPSLLCWLQIFWFYDAHLCCCFTSCFGWEIVDFEECKDDQTWNIDLLIPSTVSILSAVFNWHFATFIDMLPPAAGFLAVFSLSYCLVYKMSKNNEKCLSHFPKPKASSVQRVPTCRPCSLRVCSPVGLGPYPHPKNYKKTKRLVAKKKNTADEKESDTVLKI